MNLVDVVGIRKFSLSLIVKFYFAASGPERWIVKSLSSDSASKFPNSSLVNTRDYILYVKRKQ